MVCTWGWSLVQRSPTECGIPECDREASVMRTDWPTRGCWASGGGGFVRRRKHLAPHYVAFSTLLFPRLTQAQLSSSAPHSRTPSSHLPKLRNMINWKKHLFLRNRTVIRLIRAFFFWGGGLFLVNIQVFIIRKTCTCSLIVFLSCIHIRSPVDGRTCLIKNTSLTVLLLSLTWTNVKGSEVSYGEVLGDKSIMYIRVTLYSRVSI